MIGMHRTLCPKTLQTCRRLFEASHCNGSSVPGAYRATLVQQRWLKRTQFSTYNQWREESLLVNSKAYIDACENTGEHVRALEVLEGLSVRIIENRDIELYTSVMHIFARNSELGRLQHVCHLLTNDKLTFTPQVYAAICECIGRRPNSEENLRQLENYLAKASQQGITMNDILAKSKFVCDQRDLVLNALHRIDPSFTPTYPAPALTYTNPLLESLNRNIAPIRETGNSEAAIESPPYKISNAKCGFEPAQMQENAAEQLKNETDGVVLVKNISVDENTITEEVRACREKLDALEKEWKNDLLNAVNQYLLIAPDEKQCHEPDRTNIFPYLSLLKPEQYVNILLKELQTFGEVNVIESASTTIELYARVGRKVHSRYKTERLQKYGITDKVVRMHTKYSEMLCSGITNDNPRQLWQQINHAERGNGPDIDIPEIVWPWPVVRDVGKFLSDLLLDVIKIDANMMNATKNLSISLEPVLHIIFHDELQVHPTYMKLCRDSRKEYLTLATCSMPMRTTPLPFTSHKRGGYLITAVDLLRSRYPLSMQCDRIEHLPSPCDFYPPLDAINHLGCIPWRVNTRILDIIIKLFNSGGSDKFHVAKPPHTSNRMPDTSQLVDEIDPAMSRPYELWCGTLYKLSVANHFRDGPFWVPHKMNFRGRVSPIPYHLNHASSDLFRAILNFHQKQPLGENGLNWLKLHCINLTGLKKRDSVQDRIAYAESIIDRIIDSADNPLDGQLWWLQSDEPWQTLACCMEIANAIRSPDPVAYMSCLPIHQDGSCNVLQHYAALGRDEAGAISANLTPCDVPQDVYSSVAELVEKSRAADAQKGKAIAIELEGRITRGVVKKTVMTSVLGSTVNGARIKIKKELNNLENFPRSSLNEAASYLSEKISKNLGEAFTSATMIRNWLTKSVHCIAKQKGRHVEWMTPLGFPVVQPYINKADQGMVSDRFAEVNANKENKAFLTNFIHSLDASHMMLTSLHCERAGITFMSVHDCFWTHANSVPVMNRICREQFVSLHSQPILEDLSKFFCEQYVVDPHSVSASEEVFFRLPKPGKFNLKDVLDSVYFFS